MTGRVRKNLSSGNILRPRVGIIGGGIFGATCALILAKYCEVTLFELNADLLGGASYANQYRHHMGFHYPQSASTIREIKEAAAAFNRFYGRAVSRQFPSYYCINKHGSKVSAKAFLEICRQLKLPYSVAYPDGESLSRSAVTLCVKTPEAVYNFRRLKSLVEVRLKKAKVHLKLRHRITGASLDASGEKILTALYNGRKRQYVFNYVVDATYSRCNEFCSWLGFPPRRLEFRLKELIVIRIPKQERAAVTVMDGPFATLVPVAGSKDLYTLGDVPLSIHKQTTSASRAFAFYAQNPRSRWRQMLKHCRVWFPLLKKARYIKSMFIVLPVEVSSRNTDARPTELTYHGSGRWSILSGKIITAVITARKILMQVRALERVRVKTH